MAKQKIKGVVAHNGMELAKVMGLSPSDGVEIEFRAVLTSKIRSEAKRQKLTHTEIARRAETSRTRVTAILNGNLHEVSTGLLLRLLGALGVGLRVQFAKAA